MNNPKEHPACHVFAVDENCEEYILDVSYKKVRVDNDLLLDLAAMDYENHYRNTSRMTQLLTKLLFWD